MLEGQTFFFEWEVRLIEWIQAHMGAAGGNIASFLSIFGDELVSVSIVAFLYWCIDKRIGRAVGLNLIMGCVWNPLVKNIFVRRRPYFDSPGVKCLKPVEENYDIYDMKAQGYSFPSGHSTTSVASTGSLAYFFRKKWLTIIAIVLPLLVGLSRVSLGVHYPTDVICGWTLGVAVVLLVPFLQDKIKNEWLFYGILLLTAVPGLFYCKSDDYFTGLGMLIGISAAVLFEERIVNFENTRKPLIMFLRMLFGYALFFALNALLKLPFNEAFLDSGTILAHLVRTLRYAIIIFTTMGIYPMFFGVFSKNQPSEK